MQLLIIRAIVFVALLQGQCDRHACIVPCCVVTPYFLSAGDNVVELYREDACIPWCFIFSFKTFIDSLLDQSTRLLVFQLLIQCVN